MFGFASRSISVLLLLVVVYVCLKLRAKVDDLEKEIGRIQIFNTLVNMSPDSQLICNFDGFFTFFNDAVCSALQMTPDEIRRTPFMLSYIQMISENAG